MKIAILNDKGGVGKTAIDLDPYGNLATRVPNTTTIGHREKVSLPLGGCVVDFGGFAHDQEDSLLDGVDVVVIPYTPTAEAVETTYTMLQRLKKLETPVLFVANRVNKTKDKEAIEASFKLFSSCLKYGANLFIIQESQAIKTAVNNKFSVIKKSKAKGLAGYSYKNIANTFVELEATIKRTTKGEITNV